MTTAGNIPTDPLYEWQGEFAERLRRAVATAHRLTDDQLATNDEAVLIRAIVDRHAAMPVTPRFDLKWIDTVEMKHPEALEAQNASPMRISLNVPVEGAGEVLFNAARGIISSGGTTLSQLQKSGFPKWHASVTFLVAEGEEAMAQFEDGLKKTWDSWEEALLEKAKVANQTIAEHRDAVEAAILPIIRARRGRTLALRAASANLSIPLRPMIEPSVTIPIKPSILTLDQVEQARISGTPEPALVESIADSLVAMIASFGRALERLPVVADRLLGENEEGIRDLLLFILNSNYGGLATGETFVGSGKTDILLRWRDKDAFIAECKFWHGETKFAEAIDQLLGYTVWRDTRIALVLFIRDRADVTAAIEKAVATIRRHERFLSEVDSKAGATPEFILASNVDARRAIRLSLIIVAVPRRV